MTDVPDVMSFPPLPPSPAEVGDLILQTREHVQALGWGNREALYPASHVRAVMYECAIMSAARERERHADAMRCALDALDYCIEDSAELLSERTAQWGQYRQDRQAAMAATLERHRAVAERLRAMLRAQRSSGAADNGRGNMTEAHQIDRPLAVGSHEGLAGSPEKRHNL